MFFFNDSVYVQKLKHKWKINIEKINYYMPTKVLIEWWT